MALAPNWVMVGDTPLVVEMQLLPLIHYSWTAAEAVVMVNTVAAKLKAYANVLIVGFSFSHGIFTVYP